LATPRSKDRRSKRNILKASLRTLKTTNSKTAEWEARSQSLEFGKSMRNLISKQNKLAKAVFLITLAKKKTAPRRATT